MPQTLTLLLDLRPGEKGMTENQAPLSKGRQPGASQLSGLPGAPQSGCQEPEPGQEALEPIIQGSHLASSPSGDGDSVTSSGCPYREGRVPEQARAISWATYLVDTRLKCPSCPQW
jgi:hypothetical protein